jgi:hypothetical protein
LIILIILGEVLILIQVKTGVGPLERNVAFTQHLAAYTPQYTVKQNWFSSSQAGRQAHMISLFHALREN